MSASSHPPFGTLLRDWRLRRRFSQLELSLEADISSRHLSYLETGRAQPSREMVVRLADHLGVPLRETNALLLAAGFAPVYRSRSLDDPGMRPVRDMISRVLRGHEPYPALAIDRYWTLVAANRAVAPLLDGCAPFLLAPPVNVLRLSLHPEGLAGRIANLGAWKAHCLHRLRSQMAQAADPALAALLDELAAYPAPRADGPDAPSDAAGSDVAVLLEVVAGERLLRFLSTTMVFGTPRDVTVSELAIEAFLPADDDTADALAA